MTDIFISYAREDLNYAKWIADKAAAQGYSVWWDRDMAVGADIHEVILRELSQARHVIVIWSRNSVGSRWVRDEADRAAQQNKLMPICIDGSDPPLGFGTYNIIHMNDWNADFKRILQSMPPKAVGHTMSYIIESNDVDQKQIKNLFRGLDADAVGQTLGILKDHGHGTWLKTAPQRKKLFGIAGGWLSNAKKSATSGASKDRSAQRHSYDRAKPAPFAQRMVAWLLDLTFVAILTSMVLVMVGSAGSNPGFITGVGIWCVYNMLFLGVITPGRTPGYAIISLRLIDQNSRADPGFKAILIFALLQWFPLSWVWYFADSRQRMLHNIASSTLSIAT